MKKLLAIISVLLLASCASKEPPFDIVAKFREAEEKMRKEYYDEARKAYQEIQEKAPDRSYDADIMLRIADTYFGEEKYGEAQVEYQSFLNFHPVHRDAPYAQYQIGMCSYKEITTTDRDPAVVRAAIREFQRLLEKYPRSAYEDQARAYIADLRNHLAEYELYVGRFYYKKGSYKAAAGRFEALLREYPGSKAEPDALYYGGLAYLEAGEKAQALKFLETLKQKYPAALDRIDPLRKKLTAQ